MSSRIQTTVYTAEQLEALLEPARASWFWDRVDVVPDDPFACWRWVGETGSVLPSGHVRVWYADTGLRFLVHRLAYLLAGGDLEYGDLVRHRCPGDPTPACCSYLHLSRGTALENAQDRDRAGRRTPFLPRGEEHWSSRLSNADAGRMREARSLGIKADDVARIFGVSRATVYAVWSRERYWSPTDDADSASLAEWCA